MEFGTVFRGTDYRETMTRGEDFVLDFDVNENDGGSCGVVVKGEPVDGREVAVVARARVLGTSASLPVSTFKAREGNEETPTRISVRIAKENVERVFSDGAFQAFELWVGFKEGTVTSTICAGEVTVNDTAAGGFAA